MTPGPAGAPLKVLHVLGNYPIPPLGGIETVVVNLSEGLSGLGVENRVVAAAHGPHHDRRDGTEFFGVRAGFVSNWIQIPSVSAWSSLREHVRWGDLVHVHNPPELFNLAALALSQEERRPVVLSLLSPGRLVAHPRRLFRWAGVGGERVLREATTRAAAVQVKNELDFQYVRSLRSDALLIPDGVEDLLLSAPPAPSSPPGAPAERRRFPGILYLGRLHPLKGPEDLVEALPLLTSQFPGVHVVFAGPDVEGMASHVRSRAQELGVEGRVTVLGAVDGATKLTLLDSCQVVAIPSRADFVEGFSIVASEAWARSKPVAAYPVGALKARVRNGENGYLATSVSVPALAEAVAKATSMGRVKIPPDVVGWKEVARRFKAVYEGVLAPRPTSLAVSG